jgi:hypothetical protein
MRVTFPKIDGSVPTSVLRSRYHRHAVRAAVCWQGESEQMAIGTTKEALALAFAAIASRDYAQQVRQELRRRNVTV